MKHILYSPHSCSAGVRYMVRALMIEGCIIGLFVIANGIYVVTFPQVNDEPQGYAIIAIGIFNPCHPSSQPDHG